jgi:predicted nucleotidyltransferase
MNHSINITRIKAVSSALQKKELAVVFVGGATASLYADIDFREEVRPTDDVDVVVEIATYKNFYATEEKLRELGFKNDIESRIICRYKYQGLIVDIMPTEENVLGFSNKWYAAGFKQAIDFEIDKQCTVKIFTSAYFLASKLEAFKSRGNNDGRTSTDFEDIIFVLNTRSAIWQDLLDAPKDVNDYLKMEFNQLLANPYFDEWVSVHLNYTEQRRVNFIIGSIGEFVNSQINDH